MGGQVLVHDPNVRPEAPAGLAEQVSLDALLSRSRTVSLHARVTEETTGMIGRAEIAAMPRGAILVNCARGASSITTRVGALCQPWCISGQVRSRKPAFECVFAQVVGWWVGWRGTFVTLAESTTA